MKEKMYYSSSDITTLLGIDIGTLYYWERTYNILPGHSATGRKRYSPQQMEQLRTVYYLVKEKGLTSEAVKRILAEGNSFVAEERKAEAVAALKRADKTLEALMKELKLFCRVSMSQKKRE